MLNKRHILTAVLALALVFPLGLIACIRPLGPPLPVSPRHAVVTIDRTLDGVPVRIHAIPTGFVQIKGCHHEGCLPERWPYLARFACILGDRRFVEPLPIWTYAIEHPEGLFLVDTGPPADYYDDDSWAGDPVSRRLVRSFIRLDVGAGETLPERLAEIGLSPADAVGVVLTHQHIDHTGTVPAFAGASIWTTRAEQNAGDQIGAMRWRWASAQTRFRFVDEEGAEGVSLAIGLTAHHTPGHTPGSVSVHLRTDQGDLWFIGDTAFDVPGLAIDAPLAGIHTDPMAVRDLHRFHRAEAGIVLAAHDAEAARLLQESP